MLWMWVEWVLLFLALGFFTITEVYQPYVTIGLGLLVVSVLVRGFRSGNIIPYSGLDFPIGLFIASAALASWIAYDQATALLQFARVLAATALFYSICDSTITIRRWLGAGFVLAAVFLAIYWPLQHDFTAEPTLFRPINEIGMWINAKAPELDLRALTGPSIHKNVAGATLALAIPFSLVLTWDMWQERRHVAAILSGFATFLVVCGLVLTSTRGAWLSLIAAAGLVALAWVQRQWFATNNRKILFWGTVALLVIGIIGSLLVTGNFVHLIGQIPDPTGTLQSRTHLWRQGLGLIRDYPFTGCGLMSFWMVHATYALLIHTPYIAHSHNTFLEVWIEQGIFGAVALAGGSVVVATWAWQTLNDKRPSLWGLAGLIGLVIVAIQSIIDVAFYVERTLPLIGMATGYAWFVTRPSPPHDKGKSKSTRWILATILVLLLLSTTIFYRPLISAWYANVGSIIQTREELSRYDPVNFDNPTMDQVRRETDLTKATTAFQGALTQRPNNATAIQRLSAIALSRGEYNLAQAYMQTAWDSGFRDDVTRLLYGDALVANGKTTQAAEIIVGLTWAESRLMGQAWYRYWLNEDYQRAANAWETVLLLNPDNQSAANLLTEAKKRLNP